METTNLRTDCTQECVPEGSSPPREIHSLIEKLFLFSHQHMYVSISVLGLHMLVSMFTSFSGVDLESSPTVEPCDIISQLDKN